MKQYIIRLQIPMHNIMPIQHLKRLHQLPEIPHSPALLQPPLLLQHLLQRATITILIHEVEVVIGFEHFDVADDVGGGLDGGEDVDFVDGALLEFGVLFELLHWDDFDGEFFFGFYVDGFVDFAVDALANGLVEGVVVDYARHDEGKGIRDYIIGPQIGIR